MDAQEQTTELLTGEKATFVLHLKDCQYGTWQGSLSWMGSNKQQHFRSVLELLKLIDSALLEQDAKTEKLEA